MWNRKEWKQNSRSNLKKNYWTLIAVCFIMSFFISEYVGSTVIFQLPADIFPESKQVEDSSKGEISEDIVENILKDMNSESTFNKATKGAMVTVINGVSKVSSIFSSGGQIVYNIITGKSKQSWIFASLGLLLNIFFLLFIKFMLIVGERRLFLENKYGENIPFGRIGFLYKWRKIKNPMMVMFMTYLFLLFWSLTIVGGVIKSYSYKMVPWILAENPDIHWKEAIALSREMMNGYKWKAFVLDLSFWYWYILVAITTGLVGIFFLNPYLRGTEAEMYFYLRAVTLEEGRGKGAFIETWTDYGKEADTIPKQNLFERHVSKDYNRTYILIDLVLLFFIFSIIGWLWEVSLHLVQDGVFVNRGTLHGPWLPIYGSGGVAILVLLRRFREKPVTFFFLTMALCGVIEYTTSWVLQKLFHTMWWDYSGYFLNLNGRICLEGLIIFAVGGCLFVYIFAPKIDDRLQKIPLPYRYTLSGILLALFTLDLTYSHFHPNTGKGITTKGN